MLDLRFLGRRLNLLENSAKFTAKITPSKTTKGNGSFGRPPRGGRPVPAFPVPEWDVAENRSGFRKIR